MSTKQAIENHQHRCDIRRQQFKDVGYLGPWIDEPDRVEFKAHGLDCLLIRQPDLFHWCGYVGVLKDHPSYGKNYDDMDINIHGGLTYAEECGGHVCHFTENEDKAFWFGFDCAHFQDLSPGMEMHRKVIEQTPNSPKEIKEIHQKLQELKNLSSYEFENSYRDLNYVKEQTIQLALQLKNLAS